MDNIWTIEQIYDKFLVTSGINTDTRTIQPDQFYIALKGENFNGNQFSEEALNKGALYAVVDEAQYATTDQHILVKDSLETLQELARFHRQQLAIPIIGLTGSNGKTTTKELTQAVLSKQYTTFATQGNLNNHIGVPLSILSIAPDDQIAIIEMGANHMGEIDTLCSIAQPDFGLITNIGVAHIEGFGSKENVAKAKSELYRYILNHSQEKTVFVNQDDEQLVALSQGLHQIFYGTTSDFISGELINSSSFLKLNLSDHEQRLPVTTQLIGDYNFYNVLAAACIGRYFQIDLVDVVEAIEEYKPQNKRSQFIEKDQTNYILDAYNANPSSMRAALESLSRRPETKKLAILGSMLELGELSAQEHLNITEQALSYGIEPFLVGREFKAASQQFNLPYYKNVAALKRDFNPKDYNGYIILLKASRGIALERLLDN